MWISRKRLKELEKRIDGLESEAWFLKREKEIWWYNGVHGYRWYEDMPSVCYDYERESVAIRRILTMLLNHLGLSYEEASAKLVKKTKKA